MLQANIASGALPSPASDSQLLYMVITQPGSAAGSIGGEHSSDVVSGTRFHYGWTVNPGDIDHLTYYFSHELTEAATDPEVNVSGKLGFYVPSTNDEICDGEAQNYFYRLNNYVVQAYLSQKDAAYLIPTGQTQNFFVSSGGVLTVKGDQRTNVNDTITIDTFIDTSGGGGVSVTLNGENAQFYPGTISSIVVNDGAGNDTINVANTLAGVPVTVNLGSGSNTVNVSPSANGQGNVTVNGQGTQTFRVNLSGGSLVYLTGYHFVLSGGALSVVNATASYVIDTGVTAFNTVNFGGTNFVFDLNTSGVLKGSSGSGWFDSDTRRDGLQHHPHARQGFRVRPEHLGCAEGLIRQRLVQLRHRRDGLQHRQPARHELRVRPEHLGCAERLIRQRLVQLRHGRDGLQHRQLRRHELRVRPEHLGCAEGLIRQRLVQLRHRRDLLRGRLAERR